MILICTHIMHEFTKLVCIRALEGIASSSHLEIFCEINLMPNSLMNLWKMILISFKVWKKIVKATIEQKKLLKSRDCKILGFFQFRNRYFPIFKISIPELIPELRFLLHSDHSLYPLLYQNWNSKSILEFRNPRSILRSLISRSSKNL